MFTFDVAQGYTAKVTFRFHPKLGVMAYGRLFSGDEYTGRSISTDSIEKILKYFRRFA